MNYSKSEREKKADEIVDLVMGLSPERREASITGLQRLAEGKSIDEAFGEFVPHLIPQEALDAGREVLNVAEGSQEVQP